MTKPLPYALILRKVKRNMKSRGEFKYPTSGRVSISDPHRDVSCNWDRANVWDPRPKCGGGLHGYKWGVGVASYSMPTSTREDSHGKWLVIKALDKDVVQILEDVCGSDKVTKCKFKTGVVVFCGTRKDAIKFIANDPNCPKSIDGCVHTPERYAKRIYNRFTGC